MIDTLRKLALKAVTLEQQHSISFYSFGNTQNSLYTIVAKKDNRLDQPIALYNSVDPAVLRTQKCMYNEYEGRLYALRITGPIGWRMATFCLGTIKLTPGPADK